MAAPTRLVRLLPLLTCAQGSKSLLGILLLPLINVLLLIIKGEGTGRFTQAVPT